MNGGAQTEPPDRPLVAPDMGASGGALSSSESREVLRYWQALLRAEEALTQRPVARPRRPESQPVDTAEPRRGQEYLKLDCADCAAFLVRQRGAVQLAVQGEVAAFFEDWLAEQYQSGDDVAMVPLAGFPSFLLPKGELTTLLRFDVAIEFRSASGARYRVPAREERRPSLPAPPAPAMLVVKPALSVERVVGPAWVDLRLLNRVLRIDSDLVDALAETLRGSALAGPALVAAVVAALEAQSRRDAGQSPGSTDAAAPLLSDEELLRKLVGLCRQRLAQTGARERVFDVGLVINTRKSRTTFHVQRDIERAIQSSFDMPFSAQTPLGRFLGGQARPLAKQPCLVSTNRVGLAASQREVAAYCLGSTLCPVLGPPGTGKTTVIRNLVAQALVDHCRGWAAILPDPADPAQAGAFRLLVTSTNNRAVDNAIEPFVDAKLPLALRVGSREVSERVTLPILRRVAAFLAAASPPSDEQWRDVCAQYASRLAAATDHSRSVALRWGLEAKLAELEGAATRSEVDRSEARQSGFIPAGADASALTVAAGEALKLARRLTELSRLCERETAPVRLRTHFTRSVTENLSHLRAALGASIDLPAPPVEMDDPGLEREAWEDTAERALALVLDLQLELETAIEHGRQASDEARVATAVSELRQELRTVEVDPEPVGDAELEYALFASALALREAWATKHQQPLLKAVRSAIKTLETSRSLRPLFERHKEAGAWLAQLFPVWGCTLLSIGNHFAPEPGTFRHALVDEAAQCHPAYLVSALIRATRASVLGDVFQLEPVVALSAADERRVTAQLKLKIGAQRLEGFRVFEGSGTSGQSVANRAAAGLPALREHFRCQAPIIAICDRLCSYGLSTLTTPASAVAQLALLSAPVLFSDCGGHQQRLAGSWANESEADLALAWIVRLLEAGIAAEDIGLITPFRGQLEMLHTKLRKRGVPACFSHAETVDDAASAEPSGRVVIGTVHRFQGGERRVIVFSTTARDERSRAFLDSRVNLVNVAVSRAREHLITLGSEALLKTGRFTSELVRNAHHVARP